MIRVHSNSLLT